MTKPALGMTAMLLLWFSSAAGEEIAVTGVGMSPCSEVVQYYRTNPNPAGVELVFFSWAEGFMTGWNVASADQKDLKIDLSMMNTDDQKKYMREYCEHHPTKKYIDGIVALMGQIKHARTESPN
jgi:hypothetical protein